MRKIVFYLIGIILAGCATIDIERLADDNLTKAECQKMIKNLSIRIEHYPDAWREYYYRGIAYFKIGELELALDDLSKSIKINPQYASTYFSRGTVYIVNKKYDEAMIDMNNTINLNPNYYDVYHMRGRIHYLLKDYISALNEYDIYLKHNNKNLNIQKLKVLCLYKMKRFDEAITLMTAVKEIEDTYENAYILGEIFSASEDSNTDDNDPFIIDMSISIMKNWY